MVHAKIGPTPSRSNKSPEDLGYVIHRCSLRVWNAAASTGSQDEEQSPGAPPLVAWEKQETIEMWSPREPGTERPATGSLRNWVSHYSGLRLPSHRVRVSSSSVPAPGRRYPRPEPQREPLVSRVGWVGWACAKGARGVGRELSRTAPPSPAAPGRLSPPARPVLRAVLRRTPCPRRGQAAGLGRVLTAAPSRCVSVVLESVNSLPP